MTTIFLATLGPGLARAWRSDDQWMVDVMVPDVDVRCLVADPNHSGRVWAGTQGAGILRSNDAGLTWTSAGLDGMIVKALAVARDGRVYAGTKPPLLFVTENEGRRWVELTSFRKRREFFWFSPAEKPFTPYVQGLATNDDVIVAGIEAGAVVRSADAGETWQGHRPGALRDSAVSSKPAAPEVAPPTASTAAPAGFGQKVIDATTVGRWLSMATTLHFGTSRARRACAPIRMTQTPRFIGVATRTRA